MDSAEAGLEVVVEERQEVVRKAGQTQRKNAGDTKTRDCAWKV